MTVHFQEDIKMQCEQMWASLEVFICGNKFFVFSTITSLIFSYALQVKLCFTFCDSSLLIMSAKDKKWEVFSYFQKAKGEFLARSYTISSNKLLSNTSHHLC